MLPSHSRGRGIWGLRGAMTKVKKTRAATAALLMIPIFLLMVTVATTFQLLTLVEVPQSPANDLAKHVASALNFRDAFRQGQWLPRIQLRPTSFPSFPLYQYYSTLLGYLSLPFLAVGLKPIAAISMGVTVLRWISACAVYATGRLCSGSRAASLAGGVSYLLTPYMISNFYGRVALPEATAHAVLPILFYGLVRLHQRQDLPAALLIVIGIVGLAIAHPIFLLYAMAAAGLFVVVAFPPARAIGPMAILLGSLLLASFQWLPAFTGRGELAADLLYGSPYYARRFSSALGLFWFPKSMVEEGIWGDGARLFLTPGILTLPVVALLALKGISRLSFAVFALLCVFLFLSFPPFDIWDFIPEFTWGLQFPYRLLAFVALFVAVGLPISYPRMGWLAFAIISSVLVLQNYRLIAETPLPEPLGVNQSEIAETFINFDYLSVAQPAVFATDGTLIEFARPLTRAFMTDQNGILLKHNDFSVPRSHLPKPMSEKYVRIQGSNLSARSISISIALEKTRYKPIDGNRVVPSGSFSVTFAVPDALTVLSTNALYEDNSEPAYSSIAVSALDVIPGNLIQIADAHPSDLHLSGTTVPEDSEITIWAAAPSDPLTPLSEKISLGPGHFDAKLKLPSSAGSYVLNTSSSTSSAALKPTINVSDYEITPVDQAATNLISRNAVELIRSRAYSREFRVDWTVSTLADNTGSVRIELPLAYNSLYRLYQGGKQIASSPNFRGLTQVESDSPRDPIVAKYRLPWVVWPLMAIGAALVPFGLSITCRTHTRIKPRTLPIDLKAQ